MLYLDNAATTGHKPQSVIDAVRSALVDYSVNPGRSGYNLSIAASEKVFSCRKILKSFVNASSENGICFTNNCTESINFVLNGVLHKGDHVIISSLEHNAVYRPIVYLSKTLGIEFDIAEVDLISDDITLNNFKRLIRRNTRLIFVTAASNVCGRRLPLSRIGALCKENEILFGVDGAQGCGVFDIDMKNMHIDYLAIAPHKGFYAPMGIGVLAANRNIDNVIISGGTGVNSLEAEQPADLPERIESGTLNLPGILGTKAGVEFVKSKGRTTIEAYELGWSQKLYKSLRKIGAELYAPYPERSRFAPVISFNIKGFSSEETGEFLNRKGIAVRTGLHCSPLAHKQLGTIDRGTVRVSPSIYNKYDDVERMIFVLKTLI